MTHELCYLTSVLLTFQFVVVIALRGVQFIYEGLEKLDDRTTGA